jgi:hypothetical protein
MIEGWEEEGRWDTDKWRLRVRKGWLVEDMDTWKLRVRKGCLLEDIDTDD